MDSKEQDASPHTSAHPQNCQYFDEAESVDLTLPSGLKTQLERRQR